jgi:type I restriction enzyme M protein
LLTRLQRKDGSDQGDLKPFVAAYCPDDPSKREVAENFKYWTYEELEARPAMNLDIWADVVDESFSDPALLPPPEVIAAQIVEDATAGIEAFAAVAAEPSGGNGPDETNAGEDLLPEEPPTNEAG